MTVIEKEKFVHEYACIFAFIFYHRITCPDCRQQIRTVIEAFISFNAEDAEHFVLESYERNAALQQAPEPDQEAPEPAQDASEPDPEQNHGWLVEDNFVHENEDDSDDEFITDVSSTDEEVVELPTWNVRIAVSEHEIRIRRAR